MGTTLVKIACNYAPAMVKDAMGPSVGPSHFAVETRGGCALLPWAIKMAIEANPHLEAASLDAIKAYEEIERECIEAAFRANPYLQRLLFFFELLYKKVAGELWYYYENENFVI
jgi:hypothetical protein